MLQEALPAGCAGLARAGRRQPRLLSDDSRGDQRQGHPPTVKVLVHEYHARRTIWYSLGMADYTWENLTSEPLPALLTVHEAAERLRISENTLWRHVKAGKLPAVRVGGLVRLEVRAVDAFQIPYEVRAR